MKKVNGEHIEYPFSRMNLFLSILICILMLSVSVQGTFSWFVLSNAVNSSVGKMATVQLDWADLPDTLHFEFSGEAVEEQIELLNNIDSAVDKDVFFSEWWLDNYSNDYLSTTDYASYSGIVLTEYKFENESNIAVYLRVVPNDVEDVDVAVGVWAYLITVNEATLEEEKSYEPLIYSDGYYYYPEPLLPDDIVSIVFGAFILDDNDVDGDVLFGTSYAEIIQAANGIVTRADEWKDVADQFTPYFKPIP